MTFLLVLRRQENLHSHLGNLALYFFNAVYMLVLVFEYAFKNLTVGIITRITTKHYGRVVVFYGAILCGQVQLWSVPVELYAAVGRQLGASISHRRVIEDAPVSHDFLQRLFHSQGWAIRSRGDHRFNNISNT